MMCSAGGMKGEQHATMIVLFGQEHPEFTTVVLLLYCTTVTNCLVPSWLWLLLYTVSVNELLHFRPSARDTLRHGECVGSRRRSVRWQTSNRRRSADFGPKHVLDELGAAHLPQSTMVGIWLAVHSNQVKRMLEPNAGKLYCTGGTAGVC